MDALLPPFDPPSLSSFADCYPGPIASPVRSARGRRCMDVCVSRYLDVSAHTRRRMARVTSELVRLDRARERKKTRDLLAALANLAAPAPKPFNSDTLSALTSDHPS